MDKKYNKITLKSINELKEAFNSSFNEEIIAVLNEISGWVLVNKAKLDNGQYLVCGDKYSLESNFVKYADESSREDLELTIHFKSLTPEEDKQIYVLYDYNYDFETETGTEGAPEAGYNKVTSKINENEEFVINEITMYIDGTDEAIIHNPEEYKEQIINIVKSTNTK